MKVKALLKRLDGVKYCLLAKNGNEVEDGYVSRELGYDETSDYEDCKVVKIETIKNCDKLFITIEG